AGEHQPRDLEQLRGEDGEGDEEDEGQADAEHQKPLAVPLRTAGGSRTHDNDIVAGHGQVADDDLAELGHASRGENAGEAEPAEHGRLTPARDYWFIDAKKSSFDLASFILSSRNCMASTVPICIRMRRSTHIFDSTPCSTSSSSLRVPDLPTSSEGKMRLSLTLRSSTISELPVPLNSSKMTSS